MQLIDKITDVIRNNYVFEDKADTIATAVSDQQTTLPSAEQPHQLAAELTNILRSSSNDKHFMVRYAPNETSETEGDEEDEAIYEALFKRNNYCFHTAQRLAGNIGYLEFRLFPDVAVAAEIVMGAMAFLANTDALIFDVRRNRGGDPNMVQFLQSYLFAEPQHTGSFYSRANDTLTQMWTLPWVAGKRMSHVPVYVLMSGQSASAAEGFAYELQQLERATIVGEASMGAAHPVSAMPLCDGFVMHVPTGRPINPISNSNWEGVGVEPDVVVSAESALQTAHLHALETLAAQADNADHTAFLQWELETATAHYNPIKVDDFSAYVGTYDDHAIVLVDGQLCHQSSRGTRKLTPLGEGVFAIDDESRIVFSEQKMTLLWRDMPQQFHFSKLPAES